MLTERLQKTLNNQNRSEFSKLFSKEIAKEFEEKYNDFRNSVVNSKWVIKPSKQLKDQRQSIAITVTGNKEVGDHKYSLVSKQTYAIKTHNGQIIEQEMLSDYSILNSNIDRLNLTVAIPDRVLTGSNYDIDLILENPLEERIIAGGLIAINKDQRNLDVFDIELKPIESGGLFKSVRAPMKPGEQSWAALIAHPEGLVTVTKTVKVVSSSNELTP